MARTDPQINFRLPQKLKDKIEQAAKDNGRSVTQEVILRIEQGYSSDEKQDEFTKLGDAIYALTKEIQALKKPTA